MWQVRQLEAFHAVMTSGNMTRAAESLCVTQPAISKLVSALEDMCGFKLFRREGNQLFPTVEGELLHAEVHRMMLGTEEIKRKAGEIKEKRFGSLNIAAFPALATRVLPSIIVRFLADRPRVQVMLSGRSSVFMADWLNVQRVDIGISVLRLAQADIVSEKILSMEGVCVLPHGHPLARNKVLHARQIANQPLISLSSEDKARAMLDRYFEAANVQPKIAIETQLSESACQFAIDGAGVAIVEPLSTLGFLQNQLVVRRIEPQIYFDVWVATPSHRKSSLIAQDFIKFFKVSLCKTLSDSGLNWRAV